MIGRGGAPSEMGRDRRRGRVQPSPLDGPDLALGREGRARPSPWRFVEMLLLLLQICCLLMLDDEALFSRIFQLPHHQ